MSDGLPRTSFRDTFGHDPQVVNDSAPAERRRRIYNILENTTATAFKLEQSWIRLGVMLSEFKGAEDWRPLGYTTFDDFMEELKTKFNRGRTQLWGYLSVAEHLLPIISAEKLEEMGIAKALELKRAKKKLDGKPLPQDLVDAALKTDMTTKELRGTIAQALNMTPEPAGVWFDLDGFFMDATERAEFKTAFLATEGVLGLKKELPDHIRRKEVILTWMREWFGTHAAEFYGDQKGVETCAATFINTRTFAGVPAVPVAVEGACSFCGATSNCEHSLEG
jgi:hypothetical protein